jgi:ribonuclease BN (tRNA processing enzyme)
MTHLHWDHVLGFPHCGAIYMPGWTLDVRGVPRQGVTVLDALFDLNRPPLFPVDLRTGSGVKYVHTALEEQGNTHFHGVEIDWMPVEHPGGCTAFRFSLGGRRIVFTGDVELARTDQQALGAFSQGADVLLIDSQYTADEYPNHVGWGHSTNLDAAEFALRSGARRLLLTHHDPRHDDDDLDVMEAQARSIFTGAQAAADGMVVSSDDLP